MEIVIIQSKYYKNAKKSKSGNFQKTAQTNVFKTTFLQNFFADTFFAPDT